MRKTNKVKNEQAILLDTAELAASLCAGRTSAVKVGTAAGARVQIGRRVLWNIEKVRAYLDTVSE